MSESELVITDIIYESNEEEEMAADLIAGFKDTIRKRLFKPIDVVAPSVKKSRPDKVREEPVTKVPLGPVPLPNTTRSSNIPFITSPVKEETRSAQEGTQVYPTPVAEDTD